jgi:hypothetical protein
LSAAGPAIAALRGAASILPDTPAKARYLALLDELAAKLRSPEVASASSQAVWDAIQQALASLRGVAAMLGNDATRDGILDLIGRQAELLAQSKDGVLTLQGIRDAVNDLPDSQIKTTLRTLMDEQGENLQKVKQNMERWFNDTMDRVSGWYRRNTQLVLFLIALVVSFAMNADTLVIGNRLLQDPVLRASAAASARGVIAEEQGAAPRSAAGGTASTPDATKGQPAAAAGAQAPPGVSPPADAQPHQFDDQERRQIEGALDRLQLPIGWTGADLDKLRALIGMSGQATLTDGLAKLAGLLITTLALSMGAPFWYDVLSQFANMHIGGEKPEKSTS